MIIMVFYADSGGQQDSYNGRVRRGDDSSNNSEDGVDSQSVHFYLGAGSGTQTSISSTPVNATGSKYTPKKDHPTVSSASATPSTYSHHYQQHQHSHVVGPHDR